MNAPIHIACLPGMDGSGLLFEPFIRAAPDQVSLEVFPLNHRADMMVSDHASELIERIRAPYRILLAESYSGLIAYQIARRDPSRFDLIIFVAGFLTPPGFLARWQRLMPVHLIRQRWLTRLIGHQLLFRRESVAELADHFAQALHELPAQTLRHRLREVAHLRPPEQPINPSCIYLQPTRDQLVTRAAVRQMHAILPNMQSIQVDGTHFLLQTNPSGCWQALGPLIDHRHRL